MDPVASDARSLHAESLSRAPRRRSSSRRARKGSKAVATSAERRQTAHGRRAKYSASASPSYSRGRAAGSGPGSREAAATAAEAATATAAAVRLRHGRPAGPEGPEDLAQNTLNYLEIA